jgi:uncharacterized protein (DUF302 family)
MQVYRSKTTKPVTTFVEDLARMAQTAGFLIHNEDKMAMAHTFGRHGVDVAAGFDLHMVQICNPKKAAQSLSKNPERAILIPKFIMVFSQQGETQIRLLTYSQETVGQLIDDAAFPASLAESFTQIIDIIESAR